MHVIEYFCYISKNFEFSFDSYLQWEENIILKPEDSDGFSPVSNLLVLKSVKNLMF